jgi:HK97 family phage major capsid protein
MTDLAEIKGLVEKINPTLTELRGEIDALKERDLSDVVTQEKHDKMADDITAKMDAMQKAQAKLEAAMNRPGGDEQDTEIGRKQADEFFRKGIDLKGREMGDQKLMVEMRGKAMSTDVNPDGGYLVRPEFVDRAVSRIFETSPIRQIATVYNGSTKSIDMLIDDDEPEVNSVGEGASSGQTDTPEIGMKTIVAHKYDATPRLSNEMVEDAYFDVEAWLSGKVTRKISRKENTDFVLGNGVGKARGFLTFPAWSSAGAYQRGAIEQRNLGSAAALNSDGLIKMQGDLIEDYQAGAVWGMHRTTFASALTLKGSDNYFFSPVLLRDGQSSIQLLGKPVVFMSDMPTVAANALSVVYGDFAEGYTVFDRVGIQILRDPFRNHGFIEYYTTKRTGGDVTNYEALKIGKIAA